MSALSDHAMMARAIQLAEKGLYTTDPNPRVGCVLVKDNRIIGEGWHARAGGPHAEVAALEACSEAPKGATAYVSLEPCSHHGRTPPCAQALIDAGVVRGVAAMEDPNPRVAGQGLDQLRAAGIEVQCGLLEPQARALNPGFIKRMRGKGLFVRSKVAMSLDGRTAMASGESQWITGQEARADVQHWRARSAAIITGIGTVLADNPRLNARLDAAVNQPLRVILDSQLRTPQDAAILDGGATLIYTLNGNEQDHFRLLAGRDNVSRENVSIITLKSDSNVLDLPAVLADLAHKGTNEILLEAGAMLNGAFMKAGLVDELVCYMAPVLLGDLARGAFHIPGLDKMADKVSLKVYDVRAIGRDWRILATPAA